MQEDIEIKRSNGNGKGGKQFYYIRPKAECENRSRKVGGFTHSEIQEKIDNCVSKWFYPMVILYKIDGHIIGSNSIQNALKEYWRICDKSKINFLFDVEVNPTPLI